MIEKILTHLGLQADCGRRRLPARGSAPQDEFALGSANAASKAVHRLGRRPVARRCRGLTLPNRDRSGDSAPQAAGVGCA